MSLLASAETCVNTVTKSDFYHGMQLTIRSDHLSSNNALSVAALFERQPEGYLRNFNPFSFDWRTLENLFVNADGDVYAGVWWQRDLIAFWMLRGIKEGIEIPEFGVVVDHAYGNRGVGSLCIDLAKMHAKLAGLQGIHLTSYLRNTRAIKLYRRHGFIPTVETEDMVFMRWII